MVVSLNYRLESSKEEEEELADATCLEKAAVPSQPHIPVLILSSSSSPSSLVIQKSMSLRTSPPRHRGNPQKHPPLHRCVSLRACNCRTRCGESAHISKSEAPYFSSKALDQADEERHTESLCSVGQNGLTFATSSC